jgi:hypothetical protein
MVAADINQDKARLFTIVDSVAHDETLPVLGEIGGQLYFQPKQLAAGSEVVLEGRAALNDKDRVEAKESDDHKPEDAGVRRVPGSDPAEAFATPGSAAGGQP